MTATALLLALITFPTTATAGADASAEPAASPAPVLLEFSSPGCPPCRQMKPIIEQLKRKGYPIQVVGTDESPDLAARYKVTEVPTFIVIDPETGQQLARSKGAQSPTELAEFYNDAVTRDEASTTRDIPPPRTRTRPRPHAEDAENRERETGADEADDDAQRERPASASASAPKRVATNPRPWETVVRIKVHGQGSIGFGSGTIIHSTPEESIILTCAHIFKMDRGPQYPPSRFPLKISIDLFDGKLSDREPRQVHYSNETYEGRAIDYDFSRDVGLIRIKPGRRLPYARVVPTHWAPRAGMEMITVGCSEGRDATAWSTQITSATMRGRLSGGYEAIECSNAPKQGRSGGGLFTSDGYVAGVCDFAEPMGNHGLYAHPTSIYAMLDRNNMMAFYAPAAPRNGPMLAKNDPPRSPRSPAPITRAQSPDGDEAGDLTMPPPEFLGIKKPARVEKVGQTTTRKRWHSPSPVTTDLKLDPSADADHFESGEPPAALSQVQEEEAESRPAPMKVRQASSKWRPATTPIPD
jgi:thiol-disulfide isomerase/thioredoxin